MYVNGAKKKQSFHFLGRSWASYQRGVAMVLSLGDSPYNHGISVGFPQGQHIITVITLRRKTGTMVTQPTKWWYVKFLDTMRR